MVEAYLALPKSKRGSAQEFRVYAVSSLVDEVVSHPTTGSTRRRVGKAPYFELTLEGERLVYRHLIPGTNEYNAVDKWARVGNGKGHGIFNNPNSSANVTKEEVMQLLSN